MAHGWWVYPFERQDFIPSWRGVGSTTEGDFIPSCPHEGEPIADPNGGGVGSIMKRDWTFSRSRLWWHHRRRLHIDSLALPSQVGLGLGVRRPHVFGFSPPHLEEKCMPSCWRTDDSPLPVGGGGVGEDRMEGWRVQPLMEEEFIASWTEMLTLITNHWTLVTGNCDLGRGAVWNSRKYLWGPQKVLGSPLEYWNTHYYYCYYC